nr:hypothetical protein B0A51_06427 [Rachicladosporium sp. CCFEE 5018]
MPESIKAEPIDYIFTTFPPVSRAQTIHSSSSTTPLPEPVMSSGNTTVADDALMADMNAHDTPHGSSDGTMEMDDVVLATSTPTQHLVGFIKAVIESYLRDPQTKILLTCGADQDVENCTAFRFIKDSQAIDRCIGVLTKLDLVHISRMKIVERLLNRKAYALPQGSWFVTKQLSQSDLEAGISHEEARNIEHSFFNQPHWQRVVQDFPQQVGIGNLQQAISQIYTGTIRDHLPEIMERVNARYAAITQELTGFAEVPSHPASIVTSEVHKVQFAISVQLDPDGPAKNLYKRTLTKLINFATELHKLQPTIDWQTPGYVQPPFSVDDSSDDNATPSKVVNTPAPKVKSSKDSGAAVTPVGAGRKHQLPARSTPGPTTARKLFANQTPSQASKSTIAPTAFTLAQIREEYDASDPDPRAPNSSHVTNSLTLTTLRPWTQSTTAALSRIQNDFLTSLTAIVNDILAPRLRTKFYATMQDLLATNAKSLFHKASLAVNHALVTEQYRPMLTANTDRWELLAAPVEAKLSEQRHRKRVEEHFDRVEAHLDASKHSSTELRLKRASEAVWRAANADPYTRYVPHLVKIVTYYGIAASRFADTVAGIVTFELCREFGETVEAVLKKGPKMGDDGACKKLLEEDPGRERMRLRLLEEKSKLEMARAELEKVGGLV